MKHILSRRGALGLALAGAASPAFAQQPGFPTRAVTIIVPFPPGGATDLIARPYGAAMQRHWN
jgi:tripartite-type tricarboxylate transporter receptor subunit TctC